MCGYQVFPGGVWVLHVGVWWRCVGIRYLVVVCGYYFWYFVVLCGYHVGIWLWCVGIRYSLVVCGY